MRRWPELAPPVKLEELDGPWGQFMATTVKDWHKSGRLIELEVSDPARLPEMCERLLANPLIEDYEVLLDGDGG